MAWNEESKAQAPHWKELDVTERDITRGKIGELTRAEITSAIHNNLTHDVMRIDIENAYGDKATSGFAEETKGTATWTEESK